MKMLDDYAKKQIRKHYKEYLKVRRGVMKSGTVSIGHNLDYLKENKKFRDEYKDVLEHGHASGRSKDIVDYVLGINEKKKRNDITTLEELANIRRTRKLQVSQGKHYAKAAFNEDVASLRKKVVYATTGVGVIGAGTYGVSRLKKKRTQAGN